MTLARGPAHANESRLLFDRAGAIWWQLIEAILIYLSTTYLTVAVINDLLLHSLKMRTGPAM